MPKCPNCLENHSDKNFENYCNPCYQNVYLDYGQDPNNNTEAEDKEILERYIEKHLKK